MRREIVEWLDLKLAPDSSYTPAFVEQLIRHMSREGEVLGGRWYHFDVHSVYDAIAELEGNSRCHGTKPHSEFVGRLKGLWHKHFSGAAFLLRNLGHEVENHGDQLFYQLYPKRLQTAGLSEAEDRERGWPVLTQTLVLGALENRSRRTAKGSGKGFTGEWIIYAPSDNGRIFLTLATHEEKEFEILDRIKPSLVDFPQLRRVPCLAGL